MHPKLVWVLILSCLLGCSHPATQQSSRYNQLHDSPIVQEQDVAKIPDAQPIIEPLSILGNQKSYSINGINYQILKTSIGYKSKGKASWYGSKFHGHNTSNGEVYNMFAMTAAHKTLPLPTYLKVTNLDNNKRVIVRVNDRGPFHGGRILDLSYAAAVKLGYAGKGTANIYVEAIDPAMWKLQQQVGSKNNSGNIYLQVGAFSSINAANKIKSQLELAFSNVMIQISSDDKHKPRLHKVQVGPLSSAINVENIKLKISDMGFGIPILVKTNF